jgi:hypothetical protein
VIPATVIVHWPGRDVYACIVHAAALVKLGDAMGFTVSCTPYPPGTEPVECKNCANEATKSEAQS